MVQGDWSLHAQHDDVTLSRNSAPHTKPYHTTSKPYETRPDACDVRRATGHLDRTSAILESPGLNQTATITMPQPPPYATATRNYETGTKSMLLKLRRIMAGSQNLAAATFAPQRHAWQHQPSRIGRNSASCARIRAP